MTERQWMASSDPAVMLEEVTRDPDEPDGLLTRWLTCVGFGPGQRLNYYSSERKVFLFDCACARRIWSRLHEAHHLAVETKEGYVDGFASKESLEEAMRTAWKTCWVVSPGFELSEKMAGYLRRARYAFCAYRIGDDLKAHANLLRHLVGNPLRPFSPTLTWPETICALVSALYNGEECHYALADALMETGHVELAEHFHEPGHPKGCWAMDLILGKK
jgi:hypothetical protein